MADERGDIKEPVLLAPKASLYLRKFRTQLSVNLPPPSYKSHATNNKTFATTNHKLTFINKNIKINNLRKRK
jgi:hypothetical protein